MAFFLEFASPAQQADRDVVMAVVRRNGRALSFASQALRADRGVVLAAVANDGFALLYASPALRSDRTWCGARSSTKAARCVSPRRHFGRIEAW